MRDIRAALFAKHAQHVVLIHFPIALFLTQQATSRGVLDELIGVGRRLEIDLGHGGLHADDDGHAGQVRIG